MQLTFKLGGSGVGLRSQAKAVHPECGHIGAPNQRSAYSQHSPVAFAAAN